MGKLVTEVLLKPHNPWFHLPLPSCLVSLCQVNHSSQPSLLQEEMRLRHLCHGRLHHPHKPARSFHESIRPSSTFSHPLLRPRWPSNHNHSKPSIKLNIHNSRSNNHLFISIIGYLQVSKTNLRAATSLGHRQVCITSHPEVNLVLILLTQIISAPPSGGSWQTKPSRNPQ